MAEKRSSSRVKHKDEVTGLRGAGYRRMIEGSVAKQAGTPDEVAAVVSAYRIEHFGSSRGKERELS
jgi:hypothetical protein